MVNEIIKTTIMIRGYKEDDRKCVFDTENHGRISAFKNKDQFTGESDSLVEDLKAHKDRLISVGIQKSATQNQRGQHYYNIREFYGDTDDKEIQEAGDAFQQREEQNYQSPQPQKSNGRKEYEKDPVGLVTEIFCKVHVTGCDSEKVMVQAIELVKQARKAFE